MKNGIQVDHKNRNYVTGTGLVLCLCAAAALEIKEEVDFGTRTGGRKYSQLQ